MTEPMVRPAQPRDEPELWALDRAVWSPAHSPGPRPSGHGTFVDGGRTCLVAELGGDVVGYVSMGPPTPLDSNAHVAMIDGLAVHPEVRGRGVGARLVTAAVEHAGRDGRSRIRLRVLATNAPARRLYERYGFVVEGILEGEFRLDGADVDDVLMARPVGDR